MTLDIVPDLEIVSHLSCCILDDLNRTILPTTHRNTKLWYQYT